MGVVFDGVVCVGLAMIWAWLVGVASVLELVFKKLEPMAMNNIRCRGECKCFKVALPLQCTALWSLWY